MYFVFVGGACIVWYLFWLCLVYEKPSHHASISDEEFKYLCDAQGEDVIDYEVRIQIVGQSYIILLF